MGIGIRLNEYNIIISTIREKWFYGHINSYWVGILHTWKFTAEYAVKVNNGLVA